MGYMPQQISFFEATVREIPWRAPIAGLNILLSSHVWRQDHNGFSHQDPGFIDLLLNKANDTHVVNAYYPCDANMALAVAEREVEVCGSEAGQLRLRLLGSACEGCAGSCAGRCACKRSAIFRRSRLCSQ